MTAAEQRDTMARLQSQAHDVGHDYTSGSPHLRHGSVTRKVVSACRDAVADIVRRQGRCRVLEIGAGHGTFTAVLTRSGAEVWVTEMSGASVTLLRQRFADDPRVHIGHDPDGTGCHTGPEVDLVVCVSVLHHIPDYVGTVSAVLDRVAPGGGFVSYQDPVWYPRRTTLAAATDRGAYLLWRLSQGNLLRGVATATRRARGVYEQDNPSDMVEYHVVRQGVDERALHDLLTTRFTNVRLDRYWSTQAAWLQRLGEPRFPPNTFGLTATGRTAAQWKL